MVRAPCCEKRGLKKGPWTHQEDQILINYINFHGHPNWRALPKLAGLLRCGKSCRLRWTNYLRPDIKRGNFSRDEEETIIELHAALGNRWSAIAARLPGRTDNEIKNVWHTHLKKRVNKHETNEQSLNANQISKFQESNLEETEISRSSKSSEMNFEGQTSCADQLNSPQHSYCEISSSVTTSDNQKATCMDENDMLLENFPEIDEEFWSEVFSDGNSGDTPAVYGGGSQLQIPYMSNVHDDMDFWFSVFIRGDELQHLPLF